MRLNPVNVVVWVLPTHKSFAGISERNFTFVSNGNIYGCDTARLLLIVLAFRQKLTNSKTKTKYMSMDKRDIYNAFLSETT